MTLRALIDTDALTVFCNTDDFAESVVYWSRAALSRGDTAGRTIDAVVMREQITAFAEDGSQMNLPSFEIHVANDATNGISSTELDTGGDQIAFPPRDGKAAVRKTILQLVTQDHGMLVLECR